LALLGPGHDNGGAVALRSILVGVTSPVITETGGRYEAREPSASLRAPSFSKVPPPLSLASPIRTKRFPRVSRRDCDSYALELSLGSENLSRIGTKGRGTMRGSHSPWVLRGAQRGPPTA
jgi:hypothetical protein